MKLCGSKYSSLAGWKTCVPQEEPKHAFENGEQIIVRDLHCPSLDRVVVSSPSLRFCFKVLAAHHDFP